MKKHFLISSVIILLLFCGCSNNSSMPEHNFSLGPVNVITYPSSATHYIKDWLPDGKLISVKNGDNWIMFWAEKVSLRTEASTPYPEDHCGKLTIANEVYGNKNDGTVVDKTSGFNENGSWFIGVFPLDNAGKYVGFYHAESHRDDEPGYEGTTGIAHKSIGVTYSEDYGKNWKNSKPIITSSKTKAESSGWSGLGDGCVVYDEKNKRYLCYYQGEVPGSENSICLAMSADPEGKSGSWKKWNGVSFQTEAYNADTGKGGTNVAIRNLNYVPGANPSVMWNHYINKWIMVYQAWNPKAIFISFSKDGINWSYPSKVIGSNDNPIWYPNLISSEGDLTGGKELRLYFSYKQNPVDGKRKLAYCTLTFD